MAVRIYQSAVKDFIPLAADAISMIPEIRRLKQALQDTTTFARPLDDIAYDDETVRHMWLIQGIAIIHADIIPLLRQHNDLQKNWIKSPRQMKAITGSHMLEVVRSGKVDLYEGAHKNYKELYGVLMHVQHEMNELDKTYVGVSEYLKYAMTQLDDAQAQFERAASEDSM